MACYLLVFFVGVGVGVFLNHCIQRLPAGQPVTGTPGCRSCGARLAPTGLLPVLSWFPARGRCRSCGASPPVRNAVVEMLTGGLFIWCLAYFGVGPALVKALIFTSFLVVITFVDLDHQLIFDRVLAAMAAAGVAVNLALAYGGAGVVPGGPVPAVYGGGPLSMLAGGLLGGAVMLAIALISRGGMGGGDIKFAAVIGLWLGWQLTLTALILAFLISGVGGGLLLLLKIKGRKDFIPFGPFIAVGAFLALIYGSRILSWYLGRYAGQ